MAGGDLEEFAESIPAIDIADFLAQDDVQQDRDGEGQWKSRQHEELHDPDRTRAHGQTVPGTHLLQWVEGIRYGLVSVSFCHFVCLCVCLYVCLSNGLSACLTACLYVCLSI